MTDSGAWRWPAELAPDLLANIAAEVEDWQRPRATPGNFAAWGGVETEDYRLGRLAIDLVNARRRQVVWHASTEGRASPAMPMLSRSACC